MPFEEKRPQFPVFFYRMEAGIEPVRLWLRTLPESDRRTIGTDLRCVQSGWPVGMPLCRSLGSGLWELRSDLPSDRIARVLFSFTKSALASSMGLARKRKPRRTMF